MPKNEPERMKPTPRPRLCSNHSSAMKWGGDSATTQIQADVTQVTENDIIKVLINYETVPEPATATLSLLGSGNSPASASE